MPLRLHTPIPSLKDASRWVNSPPIDVSTLKGRPTLVHFFALSCAACEEQLPLVYEWADCYSDRLSVIGVHTPVSAQDLDDDYVEKCIGELELEHPIALDGMDGALADAYHVQYTPSYFVFDDEGRLRLYHAGVDAAPAVARALERMLGVEEEAHPST
jgi:thiol-disulfide isomerase/thioredoxin